MFNKIEHWHAPIWDSVGTDSEMRTWVLAGYLGGDPRKPEKWGLPSMVFKKKLVTLVGNYTSTPLRTSAELQSTHPTTVPTQDREAEAYIYQLSYPIG